MLALVVKVTPAEFIKMNAALGYEQAMLPSMVEPCAPVTRTKTLATGAVGVPPKLAVCPVERLNELKL